MAANMQKIKLLKLYEFLRRDLVQQVWHELNYDTGEYEDIEIGFHPRYIQTED